VSEQWPEHYGDSFVGGELAERGTIHGSGTIDIQISEETGEVAAVWFRCRSLPFRVSTVSGETRKEQPPITITAVEYLDGAP
jgi:hypothetical protein